MLQSFCNKTSHPILKRYRPGRMATGTDIVREMDNMIDKLNKREEIMQEEVTVKQRASSLNSSGSKQIMKKIINNETWNYLIDRSYNRSSIHKSYTSAMNTINDDSLRSNKTIYKSKDHNLPNLKKNQSFLDTPNKHKNSKYNMFQYFTPSPKQKRAKVSLFSKSVKPPLKGANQFRNRQLKWQHKHLPRYDQSSCQSQVG